MSSIQAGQQKLMELRECVETVNKDASKFFEKGNKAAGVRARKHLQELKTIAQELRVLIQKCKSEAAAQAGGHALPHDEEEEAAGAESPSHATTHHSVAAPQGAGA